MSTGRNRIAARRLTAFWLLGTALPATAQENAPVPPPSATEASAPLASGSAPPPDAVPAVTVDGRQSYAAADFARFAPRNALDMLRNVPGFQIRADNSGNRGLGQATENVLVNTQRLSSKSDDLFDQLARIPADSVVRIDIVDGATLSIPGLSGQAADVITRPDPFSGQFSWRGEARPHFSHPGYTDAEVSIKGTAGRFEYTAALDNDAGRGAFGGPYRLLNADGSLREAREGRLWSDYDAPKISASLKYTGASGAIGNLNASYRRRYDTYEETEDRVPVGGIAQNRVLGGRGRSYDYEIGGDYQLGLLGGQFKLIGLNRFEHDIYRDQEIISYADGRVPTGGSYAQVVDAGEIIARAEYSWKGGKAAWQIALEGAFNRLDKDASLFDLAPGGGFVEIPFPEGDGGVREDRYDASVSHGRPLTSKLSVQATLGAEHSTISQTGPAGIVRSFFRPKGSLSLAWTPEKGLDLSLKLTRAVGQLDFNDFLGRVFLNQGNQNGSNFELVPEQSWNLEIAAKKDLGKWGSANLRTFYRDVSDYIDLVPLPIGGEGRGNIPSARRYGLEWNSTFNLDPIGFRGAKIDGHVILQHSSVRDPLTARPRQFANLVTRLVELNLRHDVPGSDWAWGAGFEHVERQGYFRLDEIGYANEGPIFDAYFIENKDVFGMTVKAEVINLANARRKAYRTIYTGPRNSSPVDFIEDRDQLIGPIFRLGVTGSF